MAEKKEKGKFGKKIVVFMIIFFVYFVISCQILFYLTRLEPVSLIRWGIGGFMVELVSMAAIEVFGRKFQSKIDIAETELDHGVNHVDYDNQNEWSDI